MNIIEKLGIKLNKDGCHQFKSEAIYKSVKDAAPEMLEALIDDLFRTETEDWCEVCQNHEHSEDCKKLIAVQKATGKSWEEIKGLL